MQNKKYKKLRHNRRNKAYDKKKKTYEEEPVAVEMLKLINDIAKEDFWQMPFIERREIEEDGRDYACNGIRQGAAPFTVNWSQHNDIDQREVLKPLADKHTPVYWQAIVSNVAILKDKYNHPHGYILLDKVVKIDPESPDIFITFRRSSYDTLLDYHMWLAIDNIVYFGKNKFQELAQGDCIRGCSYIKQYETKGHESYGLAKTIITDCGIVTGDDRVRTMRGWKALNGEIISDYDRKGSWIVKLTYKDQYQTILNRYGDRSLEKLQYVRPQIHIEYDLSNQVDYQHRFKLDASHITNDINDFFYDD